RSSAKARVKPPGARCGGFVLASVGTMSSTAILVLSGLVIGALFGAVVQRTNFCAMGAISDTVALGDTKRLRAWLLAIGVAVLGTNALLLSGLVAVDKSFYLAPRVAWAAMLLGGLLF